MKAIFMGSINSTYNNIENVKSKNELSLSENLNVEIIMVVACIAGKMFI